MLCHWCFYWSYGESRLKLGRFKKKIKYFKDEINRSWSSSQKPKISKRFHWFSTQLWKSGFEEVLNILVDPTINVADNDMVSWPTCTKIFLISRPIIKFPSKSIFHAFWSEFLKMRSEFFKNSERTFVSKASDVIYEQFLWGFDRTPKLYIPSSLNIVLILWHTQLIVWAVK